MFTLGQYVGFWSRQQNVAQIFGFGDAFIPVTAPYYKMDNPVSVARNPTNGDIMIEPFRRYPEIFGPAPGPIGKSARKDAIQMDNGLFYNSYRITDFPVIRDAITVAPAANGDPYILYAGGLNAAASRQSNGYIYNTLTNTWSISFALGQSFDRSSGRAVQFVRSGVNGMLLIPGFATYSSDPVAARMVRFIDPQLLTSASSVAQLPAHPNDPTETAGVKWGGPNLVYCEQGTYTGSVFMFGGGDGTGSLSTHRNVFRLDPGAVSWVDLGVITSFSGQPYTRNACAFQSDDGRLFLAGGIGNGGGQSTEYLHEYDQDANTWTQLSDGTVPINPVGSQGGCSRTGEAGSGRFYMAGSSGGNRATMTVSIPASLNQHFDGFEQYATGDIDTVAPGEYTIVYTGAGSTSTKAVTAAVVSGGQSDNYLNKQYFRVVSTLMLTTSHRFILSTVDVPEDTWMTCVTRFELNASSAAIGMGIVFRYIDDDNYLAFYIRPGLTLSTYTVILANRVAGVTTNLSRTTITRDDMITNDTSNNGRSYLFRVRMVGTRIYAQLLHPGYNGASAADQSGTQHKGVFVECASACNDTILPLTGGPYQMGLYSLGLNSAQDMEYIHADWSEEALNIQTGSSAQVWSILTSGMITNIIPPLLDNLGLRESTASQYDKALASIGASTGKKYWEILIQRNGLLTIGNETDLIVGITTDSGVVENVNWTLSTHRSVRLDGTLWSNASNVGTFDPAAAEQYLTGLSNTNRINQGDVLQFAVDLDTNEMWIGRNGNWHDGALPSGIRGAISTVTHTLVAGTWRPWIATSNTASTNLNQITAQFAPSSWFYQVPEGYSAW